MSSATFYVTIGNSDNKLTQQEWSTFHASTGYWINRLASVGTGKIHGAWVSESAQPWQNANWCVELELGYAESLKARLADLAAKYRQDSIAWSEVKETEMIGPARAVAGD